MTRLLGTAAFLALLFFAPLGCAATAEQTPTPAPAAESAPGVASADVHPSVVVNEVLAHTDPPAVDSVELYNPADQAADIGGWYLTDDRAQPRTYRIPDGTRIAPRGFLVFTGDEMGFQLSALGEEIYLFAADGQDQLTGYVHGFTFGASANNVSFGRHVTTTGAEHFPVQSELTLWNPNSGPLVGPVVIREIMYHPHPDSGDDTGDDPGDHEYVELTNIGPVPAMLYDPMFPDNAWQLAYGDGDGQDIFTFPPGMVLPPGGRLLVTFLEPDLFRSRHAIPAEVQIVGPHPGKLSNGGEQITLLYPDHPNATGPLPYIVADRVTYDDDLPWPPAADGAGAALRRIDPAAYGDDPANWRAGGLAYLPLLAGR